MESRATAAAGPRFPLPSIISIWNICLLCFATRLVFFFWYSPVLDPGASFYWDYSSAILDHQTLGSESTPSTYIEPLYVWFLALARLVADGSVPLVITLQIAVATVGCFFLYRLALRLSGERNIAAITALIYALYPYYIRQSSAILYLTLFVTLLIATIDSFDRIRNWQSACKFGVLAVLTVLTRSTFLPIFALSLILLFWRSRFREACAALLTAVVLLGPFAFRNYSVDGSFFPSRNGWNLAKGNGEYSAQILPTYSVDLLGSYLMQKLREDRPDWQTMNPGDINRYFIGTAINYAKDHPLETLELKLRNLYYLYSPRIVPYVPPDAATHMEFSGARIHVENPGRRNPMHERVHAIVYGAILLTAIPGFFLRVREPNNLLPTLVIATLTAIYCLYWPATRLRASFDFLLMFYAAVFINDLYWRVSVLNARRPPDKEAAGR